MKTLGNILWLLLTGWLLALGWAISGLIWCISIIGIPIGIQCFKFARLALWPMGRTIVYGGGAGKLLINILWIIITGLTMAVSNALAGIVWCITIIGIPFGLQCFKMAKLALMPFGATIQKM
nr:YccF domain-containing protein [bacterium]